MGAKPMFFGRRKVGEFGGHSDVGADKNVEGCQAVAGSGREYIRCAQVSSRDEPRNLRLRGITSLGSLMHEMSYCVLSTYGFGYDTTGSIRGTSQA